MTTIPSSRNSIHLLPEALVNKIAAGEVVERPASVVKELVENAIDAGATRLAIAIEEGGRTLIRITDDGCGIPPEEIPLAFAQHATSKISSTEDLFAIATMGFRGEALASIASVSHVTMTTRTADSAQGFRAEVKDCVLSPIVPCSAPVGTTLEVRDLFYSVPARRKFLRTDPTEFSHIHEMVLRIALPNPQVAVTLSHNGRSVLELPITTDHRVRVAHALEGPASELHAQLLPLDFEERGIRITGFAGQPALARATAKYQYVFLNGRFIRDRSILHALKEAYRGLIEPTHQPVAVLFLTMDPALFDVNVHPQKTEVRFRDSNLAYSRVLAAVRERLLASDLTPQIQLARERPQLNVSEGDAQPVSDTRQVIADFLRQTPPTQPRLAFGVERGSGEFPVSSVQFPDSTTSLPVRSDQHASYEASTFGGGASPLVPSVSEQIENRKSNIENSPSPAHFNPPTDRTISNSAPKFIQLLNSYLITESADGGLLIIDQHALHERILYEELFARVSRGPLEGQRLLLPEHLPVNPRQQAVLETVRPLLADLGIEVAPFDAQSIAVHTFPSLLSKVSPREFLRDLLDKLLELGSKLTREELLHEVLDMASCKAAVKAGYPLSQNEIAALLARKDTVDRSSNCPHGRPTTLRLSLADLEKQFKRK